MQRYFAEPVEAPRHFRATALWPAFAAAAEELAGRPAVAQGSQEAWSYERLAGTAQAVAAWLAGGVEQGPVLCCPINGPWAVAFLLGAIAAGKVPVLADPTWTARELAEVVRRCAIEAVVLEGEQAGPPTAGPLAPPYGPFRLLAPAGQSAPLPAVAPRPETAFCRFTSGSTGFPRCLEFSSSAALAAARSWWSASRITPEDRVLCLATLNNGLAFNTSLLSVFLAGGALFFAAGPLVPSALRRLVERVNPTVWVAFPFVYEQLVQGAGKLPATPALRLAVSSAAPLKPEVAARFRAATGLPICNYYGLVEAGPCTFNDASVPGSLGAALPGVALAVTDEDGRQVAAGAVGRLRVRTGALAAGYLDRQGPPFAERLDGDGFFLTQDRGSLTPEGHLVLAGRMDRLINVEGRKIDPQEVEDVLRTLPAVRDVVVRDLDSGGRKVVAAFVESDSLSVDEVTAACVAQLAVYKRPQVIRVLPSLPRSAAGKVLAAELS